MGKIIIGIIGAGTISEIMLAEKSNVPIFWLTAQETSEAFLQEVYGSGIVHSNSVKEILSLVKELLQNIRNHKMKLLYFYHLKCTSYE